MANSVAVSPVVSAGTVPIINLFSLESYPINKLALAPLSIIIPASSTSPGVPSNPFANSINLSEIVVFVDSTVVVVPVTVKSPRIFVKPSTVNDFKAKLLAVCSDILYL